MNTQLPWFDLANRRRLGTGGSVGLALFGSTLLAAGPVAYWLAARMKKL